MGVFKLPLSGDVVQSINPITSFFPGAQFGLVNVTVGQSSKPEVEKDVLSDVASYGKQLGHIADALIAVIDHLETAVSPALHEDPEIKKFKEMLIGVAKIKEGYGRSARRPKHPPTK
jgi:hypothetical protein